MVDPHSVEWLAADLRRRAAVVGVFDPRGWPTPPRVDAETHRRALAMLAADCKEVAGPSGTRWQLVPEVRSRVLAESSKDPNALQTAMRDAPAGRDDGLGQHLQSLISGKPIPIEPLDLEKLRQLHAALGFAAKLVPDGFTRARTVQRQMSLRRRSDSIRALLPNGFFGREEESAQLAVFAAGFDLEPGDGAAPPVRQLVVSGAPGSGKSALLANLIESLPLDDESGPLVVHLDFDEPFLAGADLFEASFEVTRELGIAVPELDDRLAMLRQQTREKAERFDLRSRKSHENTKSFLFAFFSGLSSILGEWTNPRPVLLILDTFEEVLVAGPEARDAVLEWVQDLGAFGGFRRLRAILSGRSLRSELEGRLSTKTTWLDLEDLSDQAAKRFLVASGIERTLAELAFDRFGGNPLCLRILARFREREGADAFASLVGRDPGAQDRFCGLVAQRTLYSRILERIRDDDVRKLAYPGLLLRRVTPAIIRWVLAKPCGVTIRDDGHARELFDRLARQVWLVARDAPGVVRHRRDLRRMMLPMILETTEVRDARDAINRSVIEYYRGRSDSALSEDAQQVEQRYHELLLSPPDDIDPSSARDLLAALGGDVDDLPLRARALLRLRAGFDLSDAELSNLPERLHSEGIARRRQRQLFHGGYANVAAEVESAAAGTEDVTRETVEAAFGAGRFEWLTGHAVRIVEECIDGIGRRMIDDDLLRAPIWRLALATLVLPLERRTIAELEARASPWLEIAERRETFTVDPRPEDLLCVAIRMMSKKQQPRRSWRARDRKQEYPPWMRSIDSFAALRLTCLQDWTSQYPRRARVRADLLPTLAAWADPNAAVRVRKLKELRVSLPPRLQSQFRIADLEAAAHELAQVSIDLASLKWVLGDRFDPAAWGGRSCEMYPLLVTAMTAGLDDGGLDRVLAEVAAAVAPDGNVELDRIWPLELTSGTDGWRAHGTRTNVVPNLVDCADRLGLLHRVVDAARRHARSGSDGALIERAASLLHAYRAVLETRFSAFTEQEER